jgi:hypothetical protein
MCQRFLIEEDFTILGNMTKGRGSEMVITETTTTTRVSYGQLRAMPITIFARSTSQIRSSAVGASSSPSSISSANPPSPDFGENKNLIPTQNLSAGVQAGIGIGITFGILILLGAYAVVYKIIRKQKKSEELKKIVEKKSDHDEIGWWKSELDGEELDPLKYIHEMPGRPIMELESNQKAAELSNYNISELDSVQKLAELDGLGKESDEQRQK